MRYQEFEPRPETRSFLHCLWELETAGRDVQRIVPDGRPELIVNLAAPFEALHDGEWRLQPRVFLAGQITGPLRVRPSGPAHILGARFVPEGAARIFDFAMDEAADSFVPVEIACSTIEELETELLGRAGPSDPAVDEAVQRLMQGDTEIGPLAARLGLSPRQLQRRFKAAVGLPAKVFGRMQRFQRVFREIECGGNWVEAALACGYYDQAHLVRDIREFSGEAPAALLRGDELARHFLSHSSNTRRPVAT